MRSRRLTALVAASLALAAAPPPTPIAPIRAREERRVRWAPRRKLTALELEIAEWNLNVERRREARRTGAAA